jgi:hypothetical protein
MRGLSHVAYFEASSRRLPPLPISFLCAKRRSKNLSQLSPFAACFIFATVSPRFSASRLLSLA